MSTLAIQSIEKKRQKKGTRMMMTKNNFHISNLNLLLSLLISPLLSILPFYYFSIFPLSNFQPEDRKE